MPHRILMFTAARDVQPRCLCHYRIKEPLAPRSLERRIES